MKKEEKDTKTATSKITLQSTEDKPKGVKDSQEKEEIRNNDNYDT